MHGTIRLAASAAALACLLATPAWAQGKPNGNWTDFVTATCGANCADPAGELAIDKQNWSALVSLGTNSYVGGAYNGVTLTPSSLVAASRVMGATQLDTWLRTGQAPSADIANQMAAALVSGTGYSITIITGYGRDDNGLTPAQQQQQQIQPGTYTDPNNGSTIDNFSQGILSDGLNLNSTPGSGSALCNPSVASTQNAQAQSFVNNMMTIITGSSGVSQIGGGAVSAGQASPSGMFGSGCLQSLMDGSRDTLFSPPNLSSLISQLGSMFGGGVAGAIGGAGSSLGGSSSSSSSGSNCSNATPPLTQAMTSMPTGAFFNGGGFFPAAGFTGGEGSSDVFPVPASGPTNTSQQGGIAGLYSMN